MIPTFQPKELRLKGDRNFPMVAKQVADSGPEPKSSRVSSVYPNTEGELAKETMAPLP